MTGLRERSAQARPPGEKRPRARASSRTRHGDNSIWSVNEICGGRDAWHMLEAPTRRASVKLLLMKMVDLKVVVGAMAVRLAAAGKHLKEDAA
jgi:hypothetical protein